MSDLIQGIDVSHHNGTIDWAAQIRGGIHFAYIKATEADNYKDSALARNWAGCKDRGLFHGAYHFLHPEISGVAQAKFLASVVRDRGPGMLPPAIDVERIGGKSRPYVTGDVLDCLAETEQLFQMVPVLYASPAFLQDHMTRDSRFHHYLLWLAKWQSKSNRVPATPPDFARVNFWQWDGQDFDNDAYTGAFHTLQLLAGVNPPAAPKWWRGRELRVQHPLMGGPDVWAVRAKMRMSGRPHHFYTATVAQHVGAFQRAHQLPATGVVDLTTAHALGD